MDIRGESHPPEAAVDAGPDLVADPALDVPNREAHGAGAGGPSLAKLISLRDQIRQTLHNSLDALLDSPAQHELVLNMGGCVVDELLVDSLNGFGMNVSVNTQHPHAPGRAIEDPSLTAENGKPKGLIELVP